MTENGWPQVGADGCEWITVPGTDVNLQIQKGQPRRVMTAVAADFHAYIEPLRDADSASWTPTNAVATSNHLGGTAMDLNWNSHPFHVRGTFNADQIRTIRELLDFYEGVIFWAGDWDDPIDEMHWQMGYNTFQNPHTQDVINRKIRTDGFSTFRRGDTPALPPPPPPLSREDRYALAIMEEGRRLGITERGLKIALSVGLVETNLQNYANSNDPPSLSLPHDAVGSDHMSSGVFQQQPPWGPLQCRMDVACSARLFYDCNVGPGVRGLLHIPFDYRDESRSPGFYAQTVQGSAFPDRYDKRFDEASDIYNRLATAAPEEGFLMALSEGEQRELLDRTRQLWGALFNPIASKSRYGDPKVQWPTKDFVRNIDGHLFDLIVEHNAALGDPWSEAAVRTAASKGDAIAQAFLKRLEEPTPAVTAAPAPTPSRAAEPPPTPPAAPTPSPPQLSHEDVTAIVKETADRYIRENTPPAPTPTTQVVPQENSHELTTGQTIGKAYDALESLRLADALPIEGRAPLAALIAVLQTKNGSQLTS